MTALIPAVAQFAGRQLRAWLLVKLAGHSSVAINLDYTMIRLRGPGLLHNCRKVAR
jgi:hypothetical protein